MVDKVHHALLDPADTVHYLDVPHSTMQLWLAEEAAGRPLVHRVPPAKRSRPKFVDRYSG